MTQIKIKTLLAIQLNYEDELYGNSQYLRLEGEAVHWYEWRFTDESWVEVDEFENKKLEEIFQREKHVPKKD